MVSELSLWEGGQFQVCPVDQPIMRLVEGAHFGGREGDHTSQVV